MHVGDDPDLSPIIAGSVVIKFMSSFNYLRSTVKNTGDLNEEINWHWSLATAIMQSLWKPLWRHTCISQYTKLQIYNVLVIATLFMDLRYGCSVSNMQKWLMDLTHRLYVWLSQYDGTSTSQMPKFVYAPSN